MEVQSFVIKRAFIRGLGAWLSQLQLPGLLSRERTRFIQTLMVEMQRTESARQELISKYAEVDNKGEKKKVVENGLEHYVIPDDKEVEYAEEYRTLMEEDAVFDILPSNEHNFKQIKSVVLNTNYTFGPAEGDAPEEAEAKVRQANEYEAWCKAFEAL